MIPGSKLACWSEIVSWPPEKICSTATAEPRGEQEMRAAEINKMFDPTRD